MAFNGMSWLGSVYLSFSPLLVKIKDKQTLILAGLVKIFSLALKEIEN